MYHTVVSDSWVSCLRCVQLEAEEEALKAQLEDAELQKLKLDDQVAKETEKAKRLDEELKRYLSSAVKIMDTIFLSIATGKIDLSLWLVLKFILFKIMFVVLS